MGLRADAIQAGTDLLYCSPRLKPKAVQLLLPVWNLLNAHVDVYVASVVNETQVVPSLTDEEGNVLGYEALLNRCFDMIEAMVNQKIQIKAMKDNLPHFLALLITYIQMTEEQVSGRGFGARKRRRR
jgi:hypothetical protein